MRRYLILLVVLLAGLFWFEPWLRRVNSAEAAQYPWLPSLSPETWSTVILSTIGIALFVGLVLVVKLGLFIWRELGD